MIDRQNMLTAFAIAIAALATGCTTPAPTVADVTEFGGSPNTTTSSRESHLPDTCIGQFVEADSLSVDENNVLTGRVHYSQGPGRWKIDGGPVHSLNGPVLNHGAFGLNAERTQFGNWYSNFKSLQIDCGKDYSYTLRLDNGCARETGDIPPVSECD